MLGQRTKFEQHWNGYEQKRKASKAKNIWFEMNFCLDQLKIPFYIKGLIKKTLRQVWLSRYSGVDIMSMIHSKMNILYLEQLTMINDVKVKTPFSKWVIDHQLLSKNQRLG